LSNWTWQLYSINFFHCKLASKILWSTPEQLQWGFSLFNYKFSI